MPHFLNLHLPLRQMLFIFPIIQAVGIFQNLLIFSARFEVPPQEVQVAGWGAIDTQGTTFTDELLWVPLPLVAGSTCVNLEALFVNPDISICAGTSGKDVIFFDNR